MLYRIQVARDLEPMGSSLKHDHIDPSNANAPVLTTLEMPTTTHYIAMLELAQLGGDPLNHPAPWEFIEFQELTGHTHAPWTPEATTESTGIPAGELTALKAYAKKFFAFNVQHPTAKVRSAEREKQLAFAANPGATDEDGRIACRDWFNKKWIKWGMNDIIDKAMVACKRDIFSLAAISPDERGGSTVLPTMDNASVGVAYATIIRNTIGDEAFAIGDILEPEAARWVSSVVALSWNRYRKKYSLARRHVEGLEKSVEASFTIVSGEKCNANAVRIYLRRIKNLIEKLKLFKDKKRIQKVQFFQDQLSSMQETIEKGAKAALSPSIPPVLRKALSH
ncbi:hypothetical protein GSI_09929 [Ganoderma sinense ZZ0214-1]|uniref:Uncharacterized protein n=1 Tax=Ganoderma sinense ZZ0214-1 TaxID=1077348 RepID=A0A2G8S2J1_9APHY|nr:hypothetical protein GSI_09929 [Ganoderma sinense ZZ0214-1]